MVNHQSIFNAAGCEHWVSVDSGSLNKIWSYSTATGLFTREARPAVTVLAADYLHTVERLNRFFSDVKLRAGLSVLCPPGSGEPWSLEIEVALGNVEAKWQVGGMTQKNIVTLARSTGLVEIRARNVIPLTWEQVSRYVMVQNHVVKVHQELALPICVV